MPDGRGVCMLDGKMEDDATWTRSCIPVGYPMGRFGPVTRPDRHATMMMPVATKPFKVKAPIEP